MAVTAHRRRSKRVWRYSGTYEQIGNTHSIHMWIYPFGVHIHFRDGRLIRVKPDTLWSGNYGYNWER